MEYSSVEAYRHTNIFLICGNATLKVCIYIEEHYLILSLCCYMFFIMKLGHVLLFYFASQTVVAIVGTTIYIYICTCTLGLQPSIRRPFSIKTRVMWVPGVCIYMYMYLERSLHLEPLQVRGSMFLVFLSILFIAQTGHNGFTFREININPLKR